MPLLRLPQDLIEVRLPNRLISGAFTIGEKARFLTLKHGQNHDGACIVECHVWVTMHALTPEDDLGAELTGTGFQGRKVTLRADNQTAVEAATGRIVLQKPTDQSYDAWLLEVTAHATDLMLQAEHFIFLRDNAPLVIGDLIRNNILQAIAMGRFADDENSQPAGPASLNAEPETDETAEPETDQPAEPETDNPSTSAL